MLSYLKKTALVILVSVCFSGYTQNLQIKSKSENIEILEDSTFINQITVRFKQSNSPRIYPIIYDNELEEISNIQLFEQKRRRLKELTVGKVQEENVELDFINSKKVKSVVIPPNQDVVLKYQLTCNELMYFSSLHFSTYNDTDSLNFDIKVPHKFDFKHNIIYKDSLSYFKIDSVKTENSATWNIKVSPEQVKPDPLYYFGIYKNIKVPMMRTIITPKSYSDQTQKYMSDWYLEESSEARNLNIGVKNKLDKLTADITSPTQIIDTIYNYVKTNFKYVAIEIGMGAFIPSSANEVFSKKQGDCKDLSNFLTEALKYKGIRSDIALAATFDHTTDCDFPSLSSANHVISVAYINGEILLLDPTDYIHETGTPVQSLQDRTIFIVNSEGGKFHKVKRFPPEINEIDYNIDLRLNDETKLIEGQFDINYKGISGNYLKRGHANLSESEFLEFSKTFYSDVFGNQSISSLSMMNDPKTLHNNGEIKINGKTLEDDSSQYIFIDFFPKLFETESREYLLTGTYIGYPFKKKVNAKIELNLSIMPFKTIKHSFEEEGIELNLSINFISDKIIECKYDFIFDYIFTTNENVENINNILKSYKEIINEPLVLEKQKN